MGINRNRSFFKMKVDILRPQFDRDGNTTDVTNSIRDPMVVGYAVDITNMPCYIEPIHSDIVMDRQIASIEVARSVGFFAKDTDIRVNDIIRESANVYNNNTVKYWKVIGQLNYSRYDFHIRVDLDVMNYQRE